MADVQTYNLVRLFRRFSCSVGKRKQKIDVLFEFPTNFYIQTVPFFPFITIHK